MVSPRCKSGQRSSKVQLGVSRDFPKEIAEARKQLWPRCKDAKHKGHLASIVFPAKLVVNSKVVCDKFPDWHETLRGSRVAVAESSEPVEQSPYRPYARMGVGHGRGRGRGRRPDFHASIPSERQSFPGWFREPNKNNGGDNVVDGVDEENRGSETDSVASDMQHDVVQESEWPILQHVSTADVHSNTNTDTNQKCMGVSIGHSVSRASPTQTSQRVPAASADKPELGVNQASASIGDVRDLQYADAVKNVQAGVVPTSRTGASADGQASANRNNQGTNNSTGHQNAR